ncbi:hypothetical protein BDV93DRAFT_602776 [Ceratobasidium sp. AG-I]|nr:hypothetical protein BDV93DRAFT_602776 [Ceratobasidium sp. AG-I]
MSSPTSDYSVPPPASGYSVSSAVASSSSLESLEDGFDASRVMYRPMTSADIPRVKEMHHDLLKTSSTLAALRQSLSLSHRRTFIAFLPPSTHHPHTNRASPLIIGFSSAHITEHTPSVPPEITILAVGVDPLYRKHGVGENLIRAVCGSLLMSFTKRLTDGNALVGVEVRKGGGEGYFEKLGWEREEVGRKGLPWGHSDWVRLSKWINAHQL